MPSKPIPTPAPKTHPKFIHLIAGSDRSLYALDEAGQVWAWEQETRRWNRYSMERGEP